MYYMYTAIHVYMYVHVHAHFILYILILNTAEQTASSYLEVVYKYIHGQFPGVVIIRGSPQFLELIDSFQYRYL